MEKEHKVYLIAFDALKYQPSRVSGVIAKVSECGECEKLLPGLFVVSTADFEPEGKILFALNELAPRGEVVDPVLVLQLTHGYWRNVSSGTDAFLKRILGQK